MRPAAEQTRLCRTVLWLAVLWLVVLPVNGSWGAELKEGHPLPAILNNIYSGNEVLHYDVSWSGGIKIGDLYLDIKRVASADDAYEIHARVKDYGLFRLFYPVDDTFVTLVRGSLKLPYRYQVLQREGRGSETRRLTLYDQKGLRVRYRKNDGVEHVFTINGPVYNEFSSFFITRAMDLRPGTPFIVPTFADEKRNEVKVLVGNRENIETMFGRVRTIPVMPVMKFKGLYDKDGATVIWLTDDKCRVPVKIKSKIMIGSLIAKLVDYNNTACAEK